MTHPTVFDRVLLARRRARAFARAEAGADFLMSRVAEDLEERLAPVMRRFETAVDLSAGTGRVAESLRASGKVGRVIRLDSLAGDPARGGPDLVADEEALPLAPASVDLVASALSLQFVNDLPGALVQIRRALRPDGLFLAALIGGETLKELRDAVTRAEDEVLGGVSPRVAPFADVRDMGRLLQRAGFALPVTDVDTVTVRYASPLRLIADLRAMGAGNVLEARSRRPMTRALLARTAAIYQDRHADADGRIRATFQVISVSGWVPHESQQQPLKPGSAKMRLADALGAKEFGPGD